MLLIFQMCYKHSLKSKRFEKKNHVHISKFYVLTKLFHENRYFYVMCKKINLC
jgi:hypothetical protein